MDISLALFLSLALFTIGAMGVIIKRNVLLLFLSIELMLNAANILFVAFARFWGDVGGLMWVFFILVVAAAEAAVGIAIMINLFRLKKVADVDQYNVLRE